MFVDTWKELQQQVHENAVNKKFWDEHHGQHTSACQLMLVVCEVAEAVEALRNGNPKSEKIPEFSHVEEELADAVIRIMDFAEGNKLNVAQAILDKITYNLRRPAMHGKNF
jgi:NTP pyrophosphatase (non-canonical NTP hydrolase)